MLLKIRKVLITGITGFVGSNVAKKMLQEGIEVIGIVRMNSDLNKYKINEENVKLERHDGSLQGLIDIISDNSPDLIIHTSAFFTAEHNTDQVDELLCSNIQFSTYLFEAMKKCKVTKIINTTTSWEYFENEDYNPVCLYAATKRAVRDILKYYIEAEHFTAITLVIYDSYGDKDERNKILSLLKKVDQGIEMSMGEQKINFVHITDIVNAYLIATEMLENLEKGNYCYQLRSSEVYSLKEIANIYSEVVNKELKIDWGRRPYRKREVMEIYPFGEILPNWKPEVSLREGLKNFIDT